MTTTNKQFPGGDPATNTNTTTMGDSENAAAASSMVSPTSETGATTGNDRPVGQARASNGSEDSESPSPSDDKTPSPLGSDPFDLEDRVNAVFEERGFASNVVWGDARREVHLGSAADLTVQSPAARAPAIGFAPVTPSWSAGAQGSSALIRRPSAAQSSTPVFIARQPSQARSTNPFRAGPIIETPDNDAGDWETIFGDSNTGATRRNHQYRMLGPYSDHGSDDEGANPVMPVMFWGTGTVQQVFPAENRAPLFGLGEPGTGQPLFCTDHRLPLFGAGLGGNSDFSNRRLNSLEQGRPVFPPEQRVHRVNGVILGEEEPSNTTMTTTVTSTTRTTATMTPSQSFRSRGQVYEADDEFSSDFVDIALGPGNDTTTSSRHVRVELSQPASRPRQLEQSQIINPQIKQSDVPTFQRDNRGWLGRAVNYVATQATRLTEREESVAGRIREHAHRSRMYGDGQRGERGQRDERGERLGVRDGHSSMRGERQGGRRDEEATRNRVEQTPGRSVNLFDSISDTHPMTPEEARAVQLAFDLTPHEFSLARRRAQQLRQEATARPARPEQIFFDSSIGRAQSHRAAGSRAGTRVQQQTGESSGVFDSSQLTESFEHGTFFEHGQQYDTTPTPHRNWVEHRDQNMPPSFSQPAKTSRTPFSGLDEYFNDTDVSQILPVIPPRGPSPLSPDAHIHRQAALQCLDAVLIRDQQSTSRRPEQSLHRQPSSASAAQPQHHQANNPYQMSVSFRLGTPSGNHVRPPVYTTPPTRPPPVRAAADPYSSSPLHPLWDSALTTPSCSGPSTDTATLLRAPRRHRHRQDPDHIHSSASILLAGGSGGGDLHPSDSASNVGSAAAPARRRVPGQRNITPFLLAQQQQAPVPAPHPHVYRGPRSARAAVEVPVPGIELQEMGQRGREVRRSLSLFGFTGVGERSSGGFFALDEEEDDVEAQQAQVVRRHWLVRVAVLV